MSRIDKVSVEPNFDQSSTDDRIISASSLALEASIFGLSERYGRGRTSHTMQVWWARRPHSAMRAVTFASLAKATDSNGEILQSLLCSGSYSDKSFIEAANAIKCGESAPKVLDFFGGGGTIPFEAAAIGAESFACDYNPLSVYIQNINLVLSQAAFKKHGKSQTVEVVRESGEKLLQRVQERTKPLYPLRDSLGKERVFGYFWTYKTVCDECGTHYHLQKRPWLSKKAGRQEYMVGVGGSHGVSWSLCGDGDAEEANWQGRNGTTKCPSCGTTKSGIEFDTCLDELCAVGILRAPRGKRFEAANAVEAYPREVVDTVHKELEAKLGGLPSSEVPKWSGIINPALYGLRSHADVLNKRQRTLLMIVIDELRRVIDEAEASHSKEIADFVAGALSALIDQVVDWNCRLSMWIPQNEQVGRAFCGPGVAMLWDYAETDQLLDGPANLHDKLLRILRAVEEIPEFKNLPTVSRSKAQELPFDSEYFDAVVTDPPYYDNMFYNTLADFFYVWKRKALRDRFPDFFDLEKSEEDDELVASTKRRGSAELAHTWYCQELTKALREARRVMKPGGVLSFVYGHSSISGWSAVAQAFRDADLAIVNVQPLSIERRARPRAMTSEAVNTCIVLVAMKTEACTKVLHDQEDIGAPLQSLGWTSEDAGMATFAHEIGRLINAKGIWNQDKMKHHLIGVAKGIGANYPGFQIRDRKPL